MEQNIQVKLESTSVDIEQTLTGSRKYIMSTKAPEPDLEMVLCQAHDDRGTLRDILFMTISTSRSIEEKIRKCLDQILDQVTGTKPWYYINARW